MVVYDVYILESADHLTKVGHAGSESRPDQLMTKTDPKDGKLSSSNKIHFMPEPLLGPRLAEKKLGPAEKHERGLHCGHHLSQVWSIILYEYWGLTSASRNVAEGFSAFLLVSVIVDEYYLFVSCHSAVSSLSISSSVL